MRAHQLKTERGPEICLDAPDILKRARSELSRQNPVRLRVSGSSMRPSIEDGDLVTIEPINSQSVRTGDIILYQSMRDTALIHRIVRLEQRSSGRFIVARADASTILDEPVPIHHVLGRVTTINRGDECIDVSRTRLGWRERLVELLVRLGLRRAPERP